MRKSIVSVEFDNREYPLTYLNDSFDLQVGDTVYVEGALEGKRGTVLYINYSYKVKVGEYKKIIGVADTKVTGQFNYLNSHFVTFDPKSLPKNKVITWFKAPDIEPVEYEYGDDEESVQLVDFGKMLFLKGAGSTTRITKSNISVSKVPRVMRLLKGTKRMKWSFAIRMEKSAALCATAHARLPVSMRWQLCISLGNAWMG